MCDCVASLETGTFNICAVCILCTICMDQALCLKARGLSNHTCNCMLCGSLLVVGSAARTRRAGTLACFCPGPQPREGAMHSDCKVLGARKLHGCPCMQEQAL